MPFDDIFGEGSGAAVIFGTTGGVMEAALQKRLLSGYRKQSGSGRVQGSARYGWLEGSEI